MANRHRPGGVSDDLGVAGGIGQFLVVRQWDPVYHQDTNPAWVLDASAPGVGDLGSCQGDALLKNVGLLVFCPLTRQGGETLKIFLVDHGREGSLG